MTLYSRFDRPDARDFAPITDAQFERVNAWCNGEPILTTSTLCIGPSADDLDAQNAALFAALDAITDDSVDFDAALSALASTQPQPLQLVSGDEEPTVERVYDPVRPTPFNRAFMALHEAEEARDAAAPDSPEFHAAMVRVATAMTKYKLELERSLDDGFRQLRAIDEYRMTDDGREERNRRLRKKREEPNQSLASMTDAEKTTHRAAKAADRVWRADKRKSGWTEEQIAAGLSARQASRKAALTAS